MPCFRPIHGFRGRKKNPDTGKYPVVFKPAEAYVDLPQTVSCGRCVGCLLKRSRSWAIRCVHEAQLHDRNCFITLTYSDDYLPPDGSLRLEDFQLFMKRLRKQFGSNIRFFHCGEYGEKFKRPHYHALLFNFDFDDKIPCPINGREDLHISDTLTKLWGMGHCTIGSVTYESAAYVSRYVTKKIIGDRGVVDHRGSSENDRHASSVCIPEGPRTKVTWDDFLREKRTLPPALTPDGKKAEYITMSRRPGLGRGWLEKFSSDVYPGDFVVINGAKFAPPRYYDKSYELDNPDIFATILKSRMTRAKQNAGDSTPERLAVRERVSMKNLAMKQRRYENGS